MTAATDARIGMYLSSTGVIHATAACAVRRTRTGVRKGALITAADVALWLEHQVEHSFCDRCC